MYAMDDCPPPWCNEANKGAGFREVRHDNVEVVSLEQLPEPNCREAVPDGA
jgi:hypothetical protein